MARVVHVCSLCVHIQGHEKWVGTSCKRVNEWQDFSEHVLDGFQRRKIYTHKTMSMCVCINIVMQICKHCYIVFMCNVIYSFFLHMKTMAPRGFFSCLDFPLIQVSEDLMCLCMPGWAGEKGWCSPLGEVLPPAPVGLPALQEVQAPSSGRWGMFRKKEAGAFGAFGNQPGKLLNLFFIGCSLLIRSLF